MVEILRYLKCHHGLKSINSRWEDVTAFTYVIAFTFLMWIHFLKMYLFLIEG